MKPDLITLETELKKRLQLPFYPWGRKQSDNWDGATDFIYQATTWACFRARAEQLQPDLRAYAVNRWFNFWSARGVEQVFTGLPGVVPAVNPKDRLVDFSIQGIRFDHKTTVFPASYQPGPYHAALYPWHLARWLYDNQSGERRCHYANRLFVVLWAGPDGQHWKLRADLSGLRQVVEQYVAGFNPANLIRLELAAGQVLTDVIWYHKPERT